MKFVLCNMMHASIWFKAFYFQFQIQKVRKYISHADEKIFN